MTELVITAANVLLRMARLTSVKIFVQDDTDASPVTNEIRMLRYLKTCPQDHPGSTIARLPEDTFRIDGPTGGHHCVVSKPQSCSLWELRGMFPENKLPKELVMDAVHRLLGCINWLHLDCAVLHTGSWIPHRRCQQMLIVVEITPQNVLAESASDKCFEAIAEAERANPSVPVMDNEHPVYKSRGEPQSLLELSGQPILTDFGSSRMADPQNRGWWMPDTYRAPEVLLGLPWGIEVDTWAIGIMVCISSTPQHT